MSDADLPYLSDAWFREADRLLSEADPAADETRVGFVVVDGPSGSDIGYVMRLGPGSPGLERDGSTAPVTLTLTYDLAQAIAQGAESAQRAFLDGRIRVGGDIRHLLGNADVLASADTSLAPLHRRTRYDASS